MAKDVITRFKLDTTQYDSKLKDTVKKMRQLADEASDVGKNFAQADKEVVEYARAIGKMDTAAKDAKGGLREMSRTLADLTAQYRNLTKEEQASPFGQALSESIAEITERAGTLRDAMDDVEASIKNSASDTRAFDQITGGISLMTSGFQTAQGAAKLLGIELGDNVEVLAKLQAAMAVTSGLKEVQSLLQKQSALMMGINALQMKFNLLAKVNPYVLLAGAVTTVAAAFALFSSGADEAARAQESLNNEIENSLWQLDEIKNSADFDIAIAEAAGKSWEEIHRLRIEAAKLQEELAFQNMQNAIGAGKDVYDKAVSAFEQASDNYSKVINEGIIHHVRQQNKKTTGGGGRTGGSAAATALAPLWGSVSSYSSEIQGLRTQQQQATSNAEYARLQRAIDYLQNEIDAIQGKAGATRGVSIAAQGAAAQAASDEAFKNQILDVSMVEGPVKELTDGAKTVQVSWQDAASAIQSVGQAFAMIENPAAKVVGIIGQAIATIALGFAQATSKAAAGGPLAWIAAVAGGLGTMISTIAAIKSATAGSYAEGGIVPGNNHNDGLIANVSSGELILNAAQQRNVANMLYGQRAGNSTPYVNAETIVLGVNNYFRRIGRGEIVTTNR